MRALLTADFNVGCTIADETSHSCKERYTNAILAYSRFVKYGIIVLVAALILGCGRRHNVGPGDPDYPALNPSPKIVVQLTVIAPKSIPARFLVAYSAQANGGAIDTPSTCSYDTGMGNIHWFSVVQRVLLRPETTYLTGEIVIDKYLPGRCNYQFASSWFFAPNDQLQQDLFHFDGQPHPSTTRIDLWCVTAPLGHQLEKQCSPLWVWRTILPDAITPQIYEQIVATGGDKGPPIFIGPGTAVITVQFHDLNATDGGRQILGPK